MAPTADQPVITEATRDSSSAKSASHWAMFVHDRFSGDRTRTKHDEQNDGGLLGVSDWCQQLVELAASGLKVKRFEVSSIVCRRTRHRSLHAARPHILRAVGVQAAPAGRRPAPKGTAAVGDEGNLDTVGFLTSRKCGRAHAPENEFPAQPQ